MQNISVSYIQSEQFWEDKQANFKHYELLLSNQKIECDLLLFPEMFNTSFSMNTSFAEGMDGKSVSWLKAIAKKHNTCVGATLMIKEGEHTYNRFVVVNDTEVLAHYDKRHLFTHAGEDTYFSAENKKIFVEIKGWKILLQICYDLRFPIPSRNEYAAPYDLAIYLANWPAKRSYAWSALLQARAIENQSYLIGVNRIGVDGKGNAYDGQSAIYDPWGNSIHNSAEKDEITLFELEINDLRKIRKGFNTLKDI